MSNPFISTDEGQRNVMVKRNRRPSRSQAAFKDVSDDALLIAQEWWDSAKADLDRHEQQQAEIKRFRESPDYEEHRAAMSSRYQ